LWCRAPQCHSPSYTRGSGWTETRAECKGDAYDDKTRHAMAPTRVQLRTSRRSSEVRAQGSPPTKSFSGSSCCMVRPRTALVEDWRSGEHHTESPRRTPIAHTPITRRTMLLGAAAIAPAPATSSSGCNPILCCPVGRHCRGSPAGVPVRPRRDGMHVRRGLAAGTKRGGTWRSAGARAQRPARAGDPSLKDALGTKAAADARHSARVRTAKYLAIMLWFQGTAAPVPAEEENRPPNRGLDRIRLNPHAFDSIKNVPGLRFIRVHKSSSTGNSGA